MWYLNHVDDVTKVILSLIQGPHIYYNPNLTHMRRGGTNKKELVK